MTTALVSGRTRPDGVGDPAAAGPWDRVALTVVPLVAVLMVALRYRDNWYFYDAFAMVQRALGPSPVHAAFEPFNGHLYLVAFVAYRAQLAVGMQGHAVVWAVFCATLVACNLSVALTLRAAGVRVFAALAAAVLVTYFGPGAQLVTVEFQLGMVGAIASSFFAAWLVVGRPPSARAGAGVCALLLTAILFDSGTATAGLVFVAVLLALRWRDVWAAAAFVPALVATLAYIAVEGSGPRWSAGLGTELRLGVRLVATAAGGLIGGGAVAGGVLLAVSAVVIAVGLVTRRVPPSASACLFAGASAVLVMSGLLAVTRAGLIHDDLVDFNRYVALIAFFLMVALLPPVFAVACSLTRSRASWVEPVVVAVIALAFLLNLEPLHRYRHTVEGWQRQTHTLSAHALRQVRLGCRDGRAPADTATPLGSLAPQLTVGLLREIARRGLLDVGPGPISPAVRAATCKE